jgi:hypothetical protein
VAPPRPQAASGRWARPVGGREGGRREQPRVTPVEGVATRCEEEDDGAVACYG